MATLQEAARVSISAETMRRARRPLHKRVRRDLKRSRIIEYIRDLDQGQTVTMHDIHEAVDPSVNIVSMYQMIERMSKEGVIRVKKLKHHRLLLTVVSPAAITTPEPQLSPIELSEEEVEGGAETQGSVATPLYRNRIGEALVEARKAEAEARELDDGEAAIMAAREFGHPRLAYYIEEKAIRFAWGHPDTHNDLREFIKWLADN